MSLSWPWRNWMSYTNRGMWRRKSTLEDAPDSLSRALGESADTEIAGYSTLMEKPTGSEAPEHPAGWREQAGPE